MTLLLVSVAAVLVISAACSLSEAALYSIRMPYVRQLADAGSASGLALTRFKRNMERPITAILIVNTVANTAGASVAGAQAREVLGEGSILYFSALFTVAVLLFSEILPKVAGVTYRRAVARAVSLPLAAAVKALTPLVWFAQQLAKVFPRSDGQEASEEEVYQMAALSAEEGSILPLEAALVRNVLKLDDVAAKEIMTPRTVVFKLDASRTVAQVADEVARRPHSRIPIHAPGGPEDWTGQVLKEDVLACMARDEFEVRLEALQKPLDHIPESVPGHRLLSAFLKRRAHLLAVVDEYGGISGVVSLEDVMESLLGEEIVDETDTVVDLQQAARRRGAQQLEQRPPSAPAER